MNTSLSVFNTNECRRCQVGVEEVKTSFRSKNSMESFEKAVENFDLSEVWHQVCHHRIEHHGRQKKLPRLAQALFLCWREKQRENHQKQNEEYRWL